MFWPYWFQVLGLSLVQKTPRLQWVGIAENGAIPSTAVPIRTNGHSLYYFCEVVVSSKGGQRIPGTLKPTDNSCKYEVDGAVKSSTVFNVLVNPSGASVKWKYVSPRAGVPVGAVKCHEGDNCYLGQSIYGDGICEELPGKIFSGQTQMIMTNDKKVFRCPFKMYLVEK
ncbi:hypothetical protein SNE40_017309 [Patella caerulea]|uniref:Uncharacterized protein n=1 Tax=Patella caerulea TaxID=87958 RepID=A0AAN8JES5_PATCE